MPHMYKKPQAGSRNLVQKKTRPIIIYEWIGKTIYRKI